MSKSLYGLGGLRFWTEEEILARDQATALLALTMRQTLTRINSAWSFHRVDGPLLTPRPFISPAYTDDDVFALVAPLGDQSAALRAETTASSYLYAEHLMASGQTKMPTCIWQAGKSFRRETSDGARPSTLRYNEFYQLEFQCIYNVSTKADYRGVVEPAIQTAIRQITLAQTSRMVESDRLPSYSVSTRDVEILWKGEFKEVASISTRTDFNRENTVVLEVAIGLDRLVAIREANTLGDSSDE